MKLNVSGIGGEKNSDTSRKQRDGMRITTEGNKAELSFFNENGFPSRCGGGRGKRSGRTEGRIEDILVLIDSSIVEIFLKWRRDRVHDTDIS